MVSGNIPKKDLKKYNIKIISDLSVERNFQNHTTSALVVPINFTSTRLFTIMRKHIEAFICNCLIYKCQCLELGGFFKWTRRIFCDRCQTVLLCNNAIYILSLPLSSKGRGFILNESDPLWVSIFNSLWTFQKYVLVNLYHSVMYNTKQTLQTCKLIQKLLKSSKLETLVRSGIVISQITIAICILLENKKIHNYFIFHFIPLRLKYEKFENYSM